jgi:Trypsin-like peptidase domain
VSQIAELTPDQETQIRALLHQCVVRIQAGDSQGTGFFVAPRRVLTCRDVIDSAIRPGGTPVSVTWYQNSDDTPRELSATLGDDAPLDWPDVAILNVPEANDCPCVLLDASPVAPGTPLLTAGYTYRSLITYQLQKFIAGYPGHDKDSRPVLRIAGDILDPGESGSPIVNLQSGLVVGIVRVVRDNYSAARRFWNDFR